MKTNNMYMKEAWPVQWKLILLVALAVWLLVACGGSGGSSSTNTQPDPIGTQPDPISNEDKGRAQLAASKPGDLTQYVKNKLLTSPTSYPYANDDRFVTSVPVGAVASPAPSTNAAAAPETAFSGTTVQEQGVDEADWVKTDGEQLFALHRAKYVYTGISSGTSTSARLTAQKRLGDGQLTREVSLTLQDRNSLSGMYLSTAAQSLALLSQEHQYQTWGPIDTLTMSSVIGAPIAKGSNKVVLDIVPAQTAATPTVAQTLKIDGTLIGSRLIGKHLYLVTQWSPDLSIYYDTTPRGVTLNTARLSSMTYAEILPTIQLGIQKAQPQFAETDCFVQDKNASPEVQLTSITAIDLSSPDLKRESKCFVGGASALYVSSKSIYLSSSRYYSYPTDNSLPVFRGEQFTDIHKFSLNGSTIAYKGSGEIPGHLGWDSQKASYRMSEYQDDLRVVSYTGQSGMWGGFLPMPMPAVVTNASTTTPPATGTVITTLPGTSSVAAPTTATSPATISILREAPNQKLEVVGSLPNAKSPQPIGKPGEQVYGVKFIGTRAYVVTFRRTDPLYILDLSNPAEPKTLGELELPGFSDYLYPMSDSLLLGVGKDADGRGIATGVKLALINVSNPAAPVVNSQIVVGQSGSSSALDASPQGINIFAQNGVQRIALPIRVNESPNANNRFSSLPVSQGLHRFEVDTTVPTAQAKLISKPVVGEVVFDKNLPFNDMNYRNRNLYDERSIQIGADVYYFNAGQFLGALWQ